MMLSISRRRAIPENAPASGTDNVIADGIIHPSVVDMVAETGSTLGGFRWWRADTPMPEPLENPTIYVSNDRITWTYPPGISNPIDPWPGAATEDDKKFNSDTEMVWDADNDRLVLYWREVGITPGPAWWCATSTDGINWTHLPEPLLYGGMSMGLAQAPDGDWRAYLFNGEGNGAVFIAPSATGPWVAAETPITGWLDGTYGLAYHGDVICYQGVWMAIANVRWLGTLIAASADGYAWTWDYRNRFASYRPTMAPSAEDGYMDVWASSPIKYYRLPVSLWINLLSA